METVKLDTLKAVGENARDRIRKLLWEIPLGECATIDAIAEEAGCHRRTALNTVRELGCAVRVAGRTGHTTFVAVHPDTAKSL